MRLKGKFLRGLAVFCTLMTGNQGAMADRVYNMTRGVTPLSHEIYSLHMIIFWICVVIGIATFGVMFYALFKHRKSKGAVAAKFHEHPGLEFAWAIIPLLILILMAIPATLTLLRMEDTSKAEVTIKITAFQWKWKYEYLDQGISFFSNLATTEDEIRNKVAKKKWYLLDVDHPLVLPINKKVRFLITSNDVIHSWWVPALGVKKDAVPGFIHEAWAKILKAGTYRGQCAELCGMHHAFMPIVVNAVSDEEFNKWVESKAKPDVPKEFISLSKEELIKNGKAVYATTCAVCHKPNGKGLPPAFPSMVGGKVTVGAMSKHIDVVVNGVPNTAMQAFGLQLSDEDLAAVITYERNAWGNNDTAKYGKIAGGMVQANEIRKSKK